VNFVTFNNAELWSLQTGIPTCKTDKIIFWSLQTGIPTCKTDKIIFCDRSFNEKRRKALCSGLGLKMSPRPQTSYQVSGV